MKSFLYVAIILLSTNIKAQGILLGTPAYGGPGCHSGNLAIKTTNNKFVLNFEYFNVGSDKFGAEHNNAFKPFVINPLTDLSPLRNNCAYIIPFKIAKGQQVAVESIKYNLLTELPRDGKIVSTLDFKMGYNTGKPQFKLTTVLPASNSKTVIWKKKINIESLNWSPCKQEQLLDVSHQIMSGPIFGLHDPNNSLSYKVLEASGVEFVSNKNTPSVEIAIIFRSCSIDGSLK